MKREKGVRKEISIFLAVGFDNGEREMFLLAKGLVKEVGEVKALKDLLPD